MKFNQARGFNKTQLKVLSILHNYWIKREDQTTAAQRFFEKKTRDLFSVLLEKTPAPPRPRMVRRKAA